MAKNENLHKAKDAKKDEFYTQYEDIQKELNHYEKHFQNKTILCNCDDPFESNFCKFFLRNFNYLGLKRLICTSYSTSPVVGRQLSLFDDEDTPIAKGNGYVMDIVQVPMANGRGVSDADIDALLKSKKRGVKKLRGNGDFRSEECIKYLKQADIVVTNPPFSLFREYMAQLMEYEKEFLIIGNVNAITYKEIFPLIKDNRLWLGASIHSGDRKFYVPDDYPLRAAGCGVDKDGRKYIRVKGVRWFTNLDYATRHEELILYKRYYGNEAEYPKYDNYNAINVDKVADIPCDYFETTRVSTHSLETHNNVSSQFVKVERERERERENLLISPISPLQPNHPQAQAATASWEYQSPSSINITRRNSKSLETSTASVLNEAEATSTERECIAGFSSSAEYSGIMGVPITFLDKYNPEQFEIVGRADANISNEENRYYIKGLKDKGGAPLVNGRFVYKRILIKRRTER